MSKYHAVPTVIDGYRFASQREARRYGELKLLEKAGEIGHLELQPSFDLYVTVLTIEAKLRAAAARMKNQRAKLPVEKIGRYVADFRYRQKTLSASENDHYVTVVEDAKGFRTPLYKWKKKHVEAQYGITVREV